MTDVEKFFQELEKLDFEVTTKNFFAHKFLVPHHRIKPNGDHNIISGLSIVNFDGSNTPKGKLGCVTFTYTGTIRKKHHRICLSSVTDDVIKKAFCPKSVQEALDTFNVWKKQCRKQMESWRYVL